MTLGRVASLASLAQAAALAVLAVAVAPAPVSGHALAPSLLALREEPGGRVALRWRTPRIGAAGAEVRPRLPARCSPAEPARRESDESAATWATVLDCGPAGIVGAELAVEGLAESRTNALVHVVRADGSEVRALLSGADARLVVPARQGAIGALVQHARAGAAHLANGIDHLLFLAGLLLLLPTRRSVVVALSAFTAGHAATLGLSATGWISLPPTPVEVGISASLVLVALEATRRLAGAPPGLLGRRPAAVALGFGLVHGLGFAGALSEAGLPRDALPVALAGFHAGIELAQLAFVAIALALTAALARIAPGPGGAARGGPVVAHVIGAAGVYLLLDRLAG